MNCHENVKGMSLFAQGQPFERVELDNLETKNRQNDTSISPGRTNARKPTFPPRLEIPQSARDSHFPTASAAATGD